MPDSFVETTSTSWLSRIVGSITGVLFGIVFVIGSIALLFWNEGRAVQTARSLSEGGKVVVDAAPAPVDPGNEGKLIHLSGDAKASAPLADRTFGVTAAALRLVRVAEMYQWEEDKHQETHKSIGGSEETVTTYTYKKVWSDHAVELAELPTSRRSRQSTEAVRRSQRDRGRRHARRIQARRSRS